MLKNTYIIFAYSFTYLVEWPNRETPGLGHRKGKCKAISWQCPFPAAFAGRAAHYADRSPRSPQKHTLCYDISITKARSHLWWAASKRASMTPISWYQCSCAISSPQLDPMTQSKEQNMANHGTSLLKLVYKKIPDSTL